MENKPQLIYQKIANMIKAVEPITKDRQTQGGQKYKFRGIDDMYNNLHKIFAENEVFFTSEILNTEREERKSQKGGLLIWAISDIKFTLYATDGSFVTSVMRGEAMDSSDKASNKAASAALKYFLMQLLIIPTEGDNDNENNDHKPLPKEFDINFYKDQLELISDMKGLAAYWNQLDPNTQVKITKLFTERKNKLNAKN